jgi:hypothetical protein
MATFAFLQDGEGGITMLSYDWQTEVKISASTWVDLGMFDESTPEFSWDDDACLADRLLRRKLLAAGYVPTIEHEQRFSAYVHELVCPGPGITGQRTFNAERVS